MSKEEAYMNITIVIMMLASLVIGAAVMRYTQPNNGKRNGSELKGRGQCVACSTCKYWVLPGEKQAASNENADAGLFRIREAASGTWRMCEILSNYDADTPARFAIGDWVDGGLALITMPDFFCALHDEGKGKEKTK